MATSVEQDASRFHLDVPPMEGLQVGMGRYEKYVHREVANAKLYRFQDSTF